MSKDSRVISIGIEILRIHRGIHMKIPTAIISKCPDDNSDVTTNLRADDSFVEDEGWHKASEAYYNFIQENKNARVLYLELGVGANTPIIIKYLFQQMIKENKKAIYACINYKEFFSTEIKNRSICIDDDIDNIVREIIQLSDINYSIENIRLLKIPDYIFTIKL